MVEPDWGPWFVSPPFFPAVPRAGCPESPTPTPPPAPGVSAPYPPLSQSPLSFCGSISSNNILRKVDQRKCESLCGRSSHSIPCPSTLALGNRTSPYSHQETGSLSSPGRCGSVGIHSGRRALNDTSWTADWTMLVCGLDLCFCSENRFCAGRCGLALGRPASSWLATSSLEVGWKAQQDLR